MKEKNKASASVVESLDFTKPVTKPVKRAGYKYTEQFVSKELDSMLELLEGSEQIYTKTQLFALKPYSPQKFSQWRGKYGQSKRIPEKLQRIENILEARLVSKGLRDPRVTGFVIFLLKNNHGYTDRREVETETTHVFKVTRGDLRALKSKTLPSTLHTGKT